MLKEGELLQKYLIERKVAKGGMGWLYKGLHTTLKMPVAIKVLLPHHTDDIELRGRFLNEARIQCRLKHPHIIQVTDTVEIDDLIGIVMEWVEGGDLMHYMQQQGELLRFPQIWAIIGPVLQALQYAHDKGVVHRDIKPDNILLQQDGDWVIPKVSDFGLAKLEKGLSHNWTKDGEALGSIRYMAPEQIRSTKDVDWRADIYSLGIVLYFMATGTYPFSGTPQELLYHHISETPPCPQKINPDITFQFEDIILCCLQKDPDNRFQSCNELYTALAEVAQEYTAEHITPLSPPTRAPLLEPEPSTAIAASVLSILKSPETVNIKQNLHSVLAETLPPQKLHHPIPQEPFDAASIPHSVPALHSNQHKTHELQAHHPQPLQPPPLDQTLHSLPLPSPLAIGEDDDITVLRHPSMLPPPPPLDPHIHQEHSTQEMDWHPGFVDDPEDEEKKSELG